MLTHDLLPAGHATNQGSSLWSQFSGHKRSVDCFLTSGTSNHPLESALAICVTLRIIMDIPCADFVVLLCPQRHGRRSVDVQGAGQRWVGQRAPHSRQASPQVDQPDATGDTLRYSSLCRAVLGRAAA